MAHVPNLGTLTIFLRYLSIFIVSVYISAPYETIEWFVDINNLRLLGPLVDLEFDSSLFNYVSYVRLEDKIILSALGISVHWAEWKAFLTSRVVTKTDFWQKYLVLWKISVTS